MDKFGPDENITRAEFIVLLVRALGIEEDSTMISFKDNDLITKEEIASMIANTIKYYQPSISYPDWEQALNNYNDKQDIDSWAQKDIALAASIGIMQGMIIELILRIRMETLT